MPERCSHRKKPAKMLRRPLPIVNALGLHARAAARLVRLAAGFTSELTLIRDDSGLKANAKSILSVLHLAAAHGAKISLIADGPDEAEAMAAVEELFKSGFGEN